MTSLPQAAVHAALDAYFGRCNDGKNPKDAVIAAVEAATPYLSAEDPTTTGEQDEEESNYGRAADLLAEAADKLPGGAQGVGVLLARAQVHATLAVSDILVRLHLAEFGDGEGMDEEDAP